MSRLLLSLLLLLTGCATTGKSMAPKLRANTSMVWSAWSPDSGGKAFVVASMEGTPKGSRQVPRAAVEALVGADELLVELDEGLAERDQDAALALQAGTLDDATLGSLLTDADRQGLAALDAACGGESLLETPLKPWVAGLLAVLTCAEADGLQAVGISDLIQDHRLLMGNPPPIRQVVGFQLILDGLAHHDRDPASLRAAMGAAERKALKRAADGYLAGDEAGLAAIAHEEEARAREVLGDEAVRHRIEEPRNVWLTALLTALADDRTTVAVVPHTLLYGADGLLARLRAEGIRLTPGEPMDLVAVAELPAIELAPEPKPHPEFDVEFGGEPIYQSKLIPLGDEPASAHSWSVPLGDGTGVVALSAMHVPGFEGDVPPGDYLQGQLRGMAESAGGQSVAPVALELDGMNGIGEVLQHPDHWISVQSVFGDGWTWSLMAIATTPEVRAEVEAALERLQATFHRK